MHYIYFAFGLPFARISSGSPSVLVYATLAKDTEQHKDHIEEEKREKNGKYILFVHSIVHVHTTVKHIRAHTSNIDALNAHMREKHRRAVFLWRTKKHQQQRNESGV